MTLSDNEIELIAEYAVDYLGYMGDDLNIILDAIHASGYLDVKISTENDETTELVSMVEAVADEILSESLK